MYTVVELGQPILSALFFNKFVGVEGWGALTNKQLAPSASFGLLILDPKYATQRGCS